MRDQSQHDSASLLFGMVFIFAEEVVVCWLTCVIRYITKVDQSVSQWDIPRVDIFLYLGLGGRQIK